MPEEDGAEFEVLEFDSLSVDILDVLESLDDEVGLMVSEDIRERKPLKTPSLDCLVLPIPGMPDMTVVGLGTRVDCCCVERMIERSLPCQCDEIPVMPV